MSAWIVGVLLAATVASAAGLAAAGLLRKRSPLTRHAVLCCALGLVLLSPAAPVATSALGLGWQPPTGAAAPAVEPGATGVAKPARATGRTAPASAAGSVPRSSPPSSNTTPTGTAAWSWATLIGGIVALGALHRTLRLVRGVRSVRNLLRHMEPATEPEILAARDRAARRLGLRPTPRIGWVSSLSAPLSTTLGGASIALPAACRRGLVNADLTAVISHETSHLRHRHHRVGLFVQLALIPLWWHPLLHWLGAALREAQEDVADDGALATGVDRNDYARLLLRLAESLPTDRTLSSAAAMTLLPRGSAFARRIEGLISEERVPMTEMTTRGVALLGLFLLGAVTATLGALPAQDQKARTHDGKRYLPLQKGATWTWRVTREGSDPVEHHAEAIKQVSAGELGRCWELRTKRHEWNDWEYWAARKDGVFRFNKAYLGGMRGVRATGTPTRVLACPLGAETEWRWEELMSYQSMAGAEPIPRDQLLVRHVARLEAIAEPVEVPAGKFEAVRVVTTSTHKDWTSVTTSWWAPGVGLVREVVGRAGRPTQRKELTAYVPGKPEPTVTAEQALTRWIATNAPGTEVRWLSDEVLGTWFESRFAVTGKSILRVFDGRVAPFDPADVKHWQPLLAEERVPLRGDNADQASMEMAQACATLHSHALLGAAPKAEAQISMITSEVSTKPGSDDYDAACVVAIDRKDQDAEVHSAAMVFKAGVLESLSLDDPETKKRGGPGQIKVEVHRGGRRGR